MSYLSFGLVAFCAGTSVSFFTLPVWITFANSIAKEGSRADWSASLETLSELQ